MHTWVRGGDAAFCQITLETRYFVFFINYLLLFFFIFFLFSLTPLNITAMQRHCMRLNISTDSHVPPHSCLNSPKHAEFSRKTAILSDHNISTECNAQPTHSLCNKSVLTASHLGSRHDAARIRSSGAGSYRSISAARAQAAASGRCRSTGQTDRRTDTRPLHRPLHCILCGQRQ